MGRSHLPRKCHDVAPSRRQNTQKNVRLVIGNNSSKFGGYTALKVHMTLILTEKDKKDIMTSLCHDVVRS